jgi:hypothetical protein
MEYTDGRKERGKWSMDKLEEIAEEEPVDSSQDKIPVDSSNNQK